VAVRQQAPPLTGLLGDRDDFVQPFADGDQMLGVGGPQRARVDVIGWKAQPQGESRARDEQRCEL